MRVQVEPVLEGLIAEVANVLAAFEALHSHVAPQRVQAFVAFGTLGAGKWES